MCLSREPTLPLFYREVTERLSPTALELLLAKADIYVEGGSATGASAKGAFYGSAMLTLDLATDKLRAPVDAAQRLCTALEADKQARRAVTTRVLDVARARLVVPDDVMTGALHCRVDGARLLIDVELESA